MRYTSVVLAILLSLLLPSQGMAGPPIEIDNVTSQCLNGVSTITVTIQPTPSWGYWKNFTIYFHSSSGAPGVPWPANTNPATFNVNSSGGFQISTNVAPGCDSGTCSNPTSYIAASCNKKGMTWIHTASNAETGTVTVGCGPTGPQHCDALHGDTDCSQALPLLCIYKPTPAFQSPKGVNNQSQYYRWSGGVVATTPPIVGNVFTNLSASTDPLKNADSLCAQQFGPGWRVAEFHDGWGWNFQAYGGTVSAPTVPSTRFWVHINDQPAANCWATP